MQVKDIMTHAVVLIHPDSTLQKAAEKMKELDVGALPVSDGNRLQGMLTDRDIAVRSVSDGHDPCTEKVRDAMTPELIYCFEDQDEAEAARLMKQKQVRRLAVLNQAKQLVGIVSMGDLAGDCGNEQLAGEVLQAVSEPTTQVR
jgi:CBS domain-containing protein